MKYIVHFSIIFFNKTKIEFSKRFDLPCYRKFTADNSSQWNIALF